MMMIPICGTYPIITLALGKSNILIFPPYIISLRIPSTLLLSLSYDNNNNNDDNNDGYNDDGYNNDDNDTSMQDVY